MPDPCEICGAADWSSVYSGMIRDSSFGDDVDGERRDRMKRFLVMSSLPTNTIRDSFCNSCSELLS